MSRSYTSSPSVRLHRRIVGLLYLFLPTFIKKNFLVLKVRKKDRSKNHL